MQTDLFSFNLPSHLVAQKPLQKRGSSRMMVLRRGGNCEQIAHQEISALPMLIKPDTLMIFNDTRVRKARVHAENPATGGRSEFLFLHKDTDDTWQCLVDKAKRKRSGQQWIFPGEKQGRIIERNEKNIITITMNPPPDEDWFDHFGHMPLPPYIRREDEPGDSENYQTVFASHIGSVASPTAGLHFTTEIIEALKNRGIQIAWITLEVGPGTFMPVRSETVENHVMHSELYHVPEETSQAVEAAKREGRSILAVGTTTVRTLESAWTDAHLNSGRGKTELFIHPGYQFKLVDALLTNFHTPRSSLIMMVSAFAGQQNLMDSYKIAIEKEYRFFSYGDAMLILPEQL